MNKKIIIGIIATILVIATAAVVALYPKQQSTPAATEATTSDKVYVATENGGSIDVIDTSTRAVIKKISIAPENDTSGSMYMAHNVQVAPDNKSVWVTANVMSGEEHGSDDHGDNGHGVEESTPADQLVVIDPVKDEIVQRIDVGAGMHLAHVVLTPDSKYALTVAQETNEVYKIDTTTYGIVGKAEATAGSGPHGLRISPDGNTAYVAMMSGKSIGQLDIQSLSFDYIPLNGQAVQTAVTPDGRYVAASVFDSKSVAIYDTQSKSVQYAALPEDAKGPLQVYPTPDSRYVYVADQGYEFGQPDGNKLHKIDLEGRSVVQTVEVGTAPHGVVLSPDGRFSYVTNMVSNDVSIVDNESGKELVKVPTGEKPNGISYWTRN